MAMVSAIQEAQKDNVRSFNDYMMKVLEVRLSMLCILCVTSFFLVAICFFSVSFCVHRLITQWLT